MNHTAFLDLNGTLVTPILVNAPTEYRIVDDAPSAVAALSARGFRCPVVTIQSRIGKGVFTETAFRQWFARFAQEMRAAGAYLEGPYICPHRFSESCVCKKPQPFLYERAASELGLSLSGAYLVGDTAMDMEAARRLGAIGCLVWPRWSEGTAPPADYVGLTLTEVVRWILTQAAA